MQKTPLFSLTKKDFVMQTFCVSGPGGGGKDTSNTGVRIIHPPSGVKGEGREHRSQAQNKVAAFKRLSSDPKLQKWLKIECARRLGSPIIESPTEIMTRVDHMIANDLASGQLIIQELNF